MPVQLTELMKVDVVKNFQPHVLKEKVESQPGNFEEELIKLSLEDILVNEQLITPTEMQLEQEFCDEDKIIETPIIFLEKEENLENFSNALRIQQPLEDEREEGKESDEHHIEKIGTPDSLPILSVKDAQQANEKVVKKEIPLLESSMEPHKNKSGSEEAKSILELEQTYEEEENFAHSPQKSLKDFEKQEGVIKAEIIPEEEVVEKITLKSERVATDTTQKVLQRLQETQVQEAKVQEKVEEIIEKENSLLREKKTSKSPQFGSDLTKSLKVKPSQDKEHLLTTGAQTGIQDKESILRGVKINNEPVHQMLNGKKESDEKMTLETENKSGDQNESQNKDRDSLTRQLSDKIREARDKGETSFRLKLQPVELGRVDVEMHLSKNGSVRLSFFVEKTETLNLLEESIQQLNDSLKNEGFQMGQGAYHFNQRGDHFQQWRDATTFEKIQNVEKDQGGTEALASKISYRLVMNPNRHFDDVA